MRLSLVLIEKWASCDSYFKEPRIYAYACIFITLIQDDLMIRMRHQFTRDDILFQQAPTTPILIKRQAMHLSIGMKPDRTGDINT